MTSFTLVSNEKVAPEHDSCSLTTNKTVIKESKNSNRMKVEEIPIDTKSFTSRGKSKRPSTYIGPKVGQELMCGCCWDIMTQATTLVPCGHTYCNECVFHPENHDKRCPTCRAVIADTVPNKTIDNIVEALVSSYDVEDDDDVVVRCFSLVDVQTYRKRIASCSSEPVTFRESKRRAEQQRNERQHQRRRFLVTDTNARRSLSTQATNTTTLNQRNGNLTDDHSSRGNSSNPDGTSGPPNSSSDIVTTTPGNSDTTTLTNTVANSPLVSLAELLFLSYTMPAVSAYDMAVVENTIALSSEYNRQMQERRQSEVIPSSASVLVPPSTPPHDVTSSSYTPATSSFSNGQNTIQDTRSSWNDINFVQLLQQSFEQQQQQQQHQSRQIQEQQMEHSQELQQQRRHQPPQPLQVQNEHSWIDLLLNDARLFSSGSNNDNTNVSVSSPSPLQATTSSLLRNAGVNHAVVSSVPYIEQMSPRPIGRNAVVGASYTNNLRGEPFDVRSLSISNYWPSQMM